MVFSLKIWTHAAILVSCVDTFSVKEVVRCTVMFIWGEWTFVIEYHNRVPQLIAVCWKVLIVSRSSDAFWLYIGTPTVFQFLMWEFLMKTGPT
jgi:hypothetical protein